MLQRLNLRNFRAFKSQAFEFSKLNIFVGPNNSGKSSAISALNLIAQSIEIPDMALNPITLNGQYDQLGTFIDAVHGNRSNTPMGIDFDFGNYNLRYEYKYRQQRKEIELVKFDFDERRRSIYSYSGGRDSFDLKILGSDIEEYAGVGRKRRPRFSQMIPAFGVLSRLDLLAERNQSKDVAIAREALSIVDRHFIRARNGLRAQFSKFDTISPFRDKPQRTYLYSGEVASKIGATGSNMALMLANDEARRGAVKRDMTSEISRWFRAAGIAEGVRVKSLTSRHFELVLYDKNGSEHNICDVGFGCSQVLPVLTAALNLFSDFDHSGRRQPLLIVQEPEIHLHPNAQAALGSFFVNLLRQGGQLFLETHSDNLVLRVARHVADGMLKPDDVRIFYVHKVGGVSRVVNMGISRSGQFEPDWPGGFFPQRQAESLGLARAGYSAHRRQEDVDQLEFVYPEEDK